jgi:Ca-activated chloride channel family protein
MNLSHPWILHFLWLLPLVAVTFVVVYRKRRQALTRFAEPDLLMRLSPEGSRGRRVIKAVLSLLALGCMLLALAGPRWGSHYQEVSQKGVDIVIALDVSPSMLVEDVKPDRLERAKREVTDFLKVVQGDRVGLVAFSGAAYTQCPLTLDYGALMMFLNILHPDYIPQPGTDLGAAIEGAMKAFDPEIGNR